MARRFKPPELRGTLGTLVRSTLHQAGVVKDALLERAAQSAGRVSGRREEALAELGEAVLELIRAGEIDLDELPEVRAVVTELDELDDEGAAPRHRSVRRGAHATPARGRHDYDNHDDDDDNAALHDALESARFDRAALPTSRTRFDDRSPASDGTVSSGARPAPVARRPTSETKVWRPVTTPPPAAAAPAASQGGISFEDDDLADYMHPDDVPARAPSNDAPKDPPEPD
jgi:hypothetical protein|nr:hypothetical protein [Kofleriaceae bacterium]